MNAASQNQTILRHLKKFGPITFLEALRNYGVGRLGARVYDIEHMGYTVLRRWKKVGRARVMEYFGVVKQRKA